MKGIVLRVILIVVVLLGCAAAVLTKGIRLGKDLQGGVSLVYTVRLPQDGNTQETMNQVIDVLKRRINPSGVLDISVQQQGADRIEIVMPLPSEEVQKLREVYQEKLDALLNEAEINPEDVQSALESGTLTQRFGGQGALAERAARLSETFAAVRSARAELVRLRNENASEAEIQAQELKVAEVEIAEENLRTELLGFSLDKGRFIRMLSLSKEPAEVIGANKRRVLDEDGNPKTGPSPRQVELDDLKQSFSHLAGHMDEVVQAFDAYNAKRTALDDPEDLKRMLRGAGVLDFRIAVGASNAEGVNPEEMRQQLAERGPANTDSPVAAWFEINDLKQWYDKPEELDNLRADPVAYFAQRFGLVAAEYGGRYFVLLYTTPDRSMTHTNDQKWSIQRATTTYDSMGRLAVSFQLDQSGGLLMSRLTGPNVRKPMAIVLDNQVYSAPNLNSQISGSGIIEGTFSQSELDYLIRVLAAGTLEARLSPEPIATNVLGSTLGQENLRSGMWACILSVAATMVFMIGYYFFAGVVANIALVYTTMLIFGICALMDATYTLPGLAGMALTAGMAVDSNVLIYERIREEMVTNGEDLRTAIRLGFNRAFNTIFDGHMTNLIVCVVLAQLATTEVKGFAVVMIIGTVATLFTALFLTKAILVIYNEGLGFRSLPMLPTVFPAVRRAFEPSIAWVSKRFMFFGISGLACVIGMAAFISLGSKVLDMEFRGGVAATMTTRTAQAGEKADEVTGRLLLRRADVENEVHQIGIDAGPDRPAVHELRNASVLTVGRTVGDFEATSFQLKVANAEAAGESDPADEIVEALVVKFADRLNITPAITFRGSEGDTDASLHTHLLNKDRLGDNINRPTLVQPVGAYKGGVAIVLENIAPPVTLADVTDRIERARKQPEFSSTFGRQTRVIGLEPVDPANPSRGYSSLAILVRDDDIDGTRLDLSIWDRQLARTEWALARAALSDVQSLDQVSSFSSAVANTLTAKAVVAIVLSLLGILIYIWARFNSFRYSVAAIVATVHDVLLALGALALSHYLATTSIGRMLLIEEFRIDLNVIAALLTLIGYSLNDKVVIFDRIRENRGKLPLATAEIIDLSINQTMSRTVITGGTTMISLLILYIMGGPTIRPFSFVLLLGLIIGTYSSVAIAAPLVHARRVTTSSPGASGAIVPAAP